MQLINEIRYICFICLNSQGVAGSGCWSLSGIGQCTYTDSTQ